MLKSKKYFYTGDQIWNDDSDVEINSLPLANDIIADSELSSLDELIVGCWGESYDNPVQSLLDVFVENKEKLQHISRMFIGDMDYEECEVSWIEQGDYSNLLKALPNLKSLTIKGSNELSLGNIDHNNLEELEIICGGLPTSVIKQIASARLPKLKKLNLYFGVEDYGFDGTSDDIASILKADYIKNLTSLGLGDSEIQDEIVEKVVESKNLYNIKTLDLSNGTLTDKGGQMILDNISMFKGLDKLDLTYHYLSEEMMQNLRNTGINVILDEANEPDEYDGEVYYYPMLTE
jgi:hypothetical protein